MVSISCCHNNIFISWFIFVGYCLHIALANNPPRLQNFAASRVIVKSESTPPNEIIGSLIATDSDGPMPIIFSITDPSTSELVSLSPATGDSATGRSVNITLNQPLDRDREPSERKLYFSVADGDNSVEHNEIPVIVTLYITDVNDETPEFTTHRYVESVYENATIGTTVTTVKAEDPDNGLGGTISYSMEAVAQAADNAYKTAFRIDPNKGDIIINHALDYEKHNSYRFVITATDGLGLVCKVKADLVLTVLDIQDTAPSFFNLPYSENMKENASVGFSVIQVSALDGDSGVPNNLTYSFISGAYQNFALNSTTGWITIKNELDRDVGEVRQKGGVYAMYVQASEILTPGQYNIGSTSATTLVTITVTDINDNPPVFQKISYQATIFENMQNGVPITFTDSTQSLMSVSDIDQGANSHFSLTVEKNSQPYYDFYPLPKEVFSESSVSIRVNNSQALDFETTRTIIFQVVARELDTVEKLSSTATVTVTIEDMNDNQPMFNETSYQASVSEAAPVGTTVIQLTASDKDSGLFGSLTYNLRGGTDKFTINNKTGVVTVSGELDREKRNEYYLSVEAKDGGGFRTIVELKVILEDHNDNAPVFRRDDYYSVVRENTHVFLRGPLIVSASDDDQIGTNNSKVNYRIYNTPAGLQNNFTINATSGEITLTAPIDYEKLDKVLGGKIILEIEAYDLGIPVQRSKSNANVTIEVEDVNDNTPTFDQLQYTATIPENATAGTSIVKIHAVDLDGTSRNNEFLYRIDSGAQDKFRINFMTGEISVEVGATLDRETKSQYKLNMSATDRGTVQLVGNCIVTINIDDVNDEPPVFIPESRLLSINENLNVSSVVGYYSATDPDTNAILRHSILGDVQGFDENGQKVNATGLGINNYFDIRPVSAEIYIKTKIDREKVEKVVLLILATDVNAWQPSPQTATATLTVSILDSNDNPPKFTKNVYKVNISEARSPNDVVLTVAASDPDKNQLVRYYIDTDSSNSFKFMDERSGQLALKQTLDHERHPTLSFTVMARDNGSPALSSTATVEVTVQDINDNPPVFAAYLRTYSVTENAPQGTSVTSITASDLDSGDLGLVYYSLQVTNDNGCFVINKFSGEITVNCTLDFETRKTYSVYVIARDNEMNPDNQRSTQSDAIEIKILDVNDNRPDITNINNIPVRVLENAKNGSEVFRVSATDPDNGINGTVDYALTSNTNTTGWFFIQTVTNTGTGKREGVIRLKENLLDRVGVVFVTVKVTDQGTPALSSEKRLYFEIEDVNLHQPQFEKPKGPQATIQIEEQKPIGSTVVLIQASDKDHGRNGEVHFYLYPEKDYRKFRLDNNTGLLTNAEVLDREVDAEYEIKIIAYDRGLPSSYENSLTLFITLLDIDDQKPLFDRGPGFEPFRFPLGVDEERKNVRVGSVDIATDLDSSNNSIICYYIVGGEMQDYFSLNRSGELVLISPIDREGRNPPHTSINFVNLVVWATPFCYLDHVTTPKTKYLYDPTLRPSDYDSTNRTLLWLQVDINDINDHPPVFKQSIISIGLTRKTQFGELILNLKNEVTDRDIGANRVHTFVGGDWIQTYPTQLNKTIQALGRKPFILFANGTVKTNIYFQSDMFGFFNWTVKAMDTDGNIATATLRISLINDDQRVKVIFRMLPEEVRNISYRFRQQLEDVTGFRIVIDKIQTHENEAGKPDSTQTDMFIHGEDKRTNEIVDAQVLLSMIDQKAAELINVLNDYNILRIVPTTVAPQEDDSKRKLTMAVILLAIILGIPCIILIFVVYMQRKKYLRKLKAATAMAYGSQDSDMQKLELPGTNLHTYENTNPIFLEKIMLEEAGEAAVDDDDLDDNAVDPSQPKPFDTQEASMNFYGENDQNQNIGTPDMNLKDTLYIHETSKSDKQSLYPKIDKKLQNGVVDTRMVNGLQTTDI